MTHVCVLTTGTTRNPIGSIAPLDMIIAIGFGSAVVYQGDRLQIDCERPSRAAERALRVAHGDWITIRDVERLARRSPPGPWTISIAGPLWGATWERRRPGKWVCVEATEGFA